MFGRRPGGLLVVGDGFKDEAKGVEAKADNVGPEKAGGEDRGGHCIVCLGRGDDRGSNGVDGRDGRLAEDNPESLGSPGEEQLSRF